MVDSGGARPAGLPAQATGTTRRTFIRRSSAIGAGLLLPGVLGACGSSDAGGGGGDGPIRLGYVTPSTGALAAFAEADEFILQGIRAAFKDGIETKSGTRDVEIVVKDSQSSPDRAGAVATELITEDNIDLMLVASTPETTNPVSDQCELNGVPCISTMAPWQSWFFARQGNPDEPFKSTYHFFWGTEDLTGVYDDLWTQVRTNNRVGALYPNDSDGNALADSKQGVPGLIKGDFSFVDPGRYENGTNDFSAQINRFRDCEILVGAPIPPDFVNFYKQAAQQGYAPKIASVAKAVLFPSTVEALGDLGEGISTEVWWSRYHPFSSSLTGATAGEVSDAFTETTGRQWTQPIGFIHALFEVAADVLKNASDPKDKGALTEQIAKTRLETIVGPVDWTAGPVANVAKTPLVGGQWRRDGDGYDLVIVSNSLASDIEKQDRLRVVSL